MSAAGFRSAMILAAVLACASASAQDATYPVRSITPHPLVMLRDRHAGPHTSQTAIGKAYTALSFKLDTTSFARVTQSGEASSGIRQLPGVVAIGGGWPIESAGSLVGAIGVSGAPNGDADDVCAKAGIASIRDDLDL